MPEYRRYFVPGGTYFFTIVTHLRKPLFADSQNIERLRHAIREIKQDQPFEIRAAVILPDHMHFVWSLPPGDQEYSKRIGRMKVKFTQSFHSGRSLQRTVSLSRSKHRESDVWQRRFWEHTIDDEDEFERCLDYIHYNPVKHKLVSCPHLWSASTFHRWVRRGVYESSWACTCAGKDRRRFDFSDVEHLTGDVD